MSGPKGWTPPEFRISFWNSQTLSPLKWGLFSERCRAGVVGLAEFRGDWGFTHLLSNSHHVIRSDDGDNCVLIDRSSAKPISVFLDTPFALGISLEYQGAIMSVVSCHLACNAAARGAQIDVLCGVLRTHRPAVVMGDFNFDQDRGVAPSLKDLTWVALLSELHLVDPAPNTPTHFATQQQITSQASRRLDYIWTSLQVTSFHITPTPHLSDHAALTVVVIAPPPPTLTHTA